MQKTNPFGPGLEVAGQISVLVDDVPCTIECRGDVIVLSVRDIRTAISLRQKAGREIAKLTQVEDLLKQASLRLDVEVGGRPVGRLGHGVESNWVARVAGLRPFRIEVSGLVDALIGNLRRKDSS